MAFKNEEDQNVSLTEYADSEISMLKNEEFLEFSPQPQLHLEAAKQELEEFIPHVRKMSDESILKMAGTDLTRFKKFKNKGEIPREHYIDRARRQVTSESSLTEEERI